MMEDDSTLADQDVKDKKRVSSPSLWLYLLNTES